MPENEALSSLLTWVQVMVACAIVLLALALLVLVIGWMQHWPWLLRLSALVPLAVSVFAGGVAEHIHDTYLYVLQAMQAEEIYFMRASPPCCFGLEIGGRLLAQTQGAIVLGWLVVLVTGIVLAAGALGLWRLFLLPGRQVSRSASLAAGS